MYISSHTQVIAKWQSTSNLILFFQFQHMSHIKSLLQTCHTHNIVGKASVMIYVYI